MDIKLLTFILDLIDPIDLDPQFYFANLCPKKYSKLNCDYYKDKTEKNVQRIKKNLDKQNNN